MNETPQNNTPKFAGAQLDIAKVYDVLTRLGITPNYKGFHYTAYAVKMAVEDPEQLALATKRLYPDVAKHYRANVATVERNIRTVIAFAWERNPKYLEELATYPLQRKPTASQFLSILAMLFSPEGIPELRRSA